MIPKSLSATSMEVATLCMARWEAEMFHRGRGMQNDAAATGSSVHGALEMYVKEAIMEGKFPTTVKTLLDFFKMSYMTTFGTADTSGENYDDGIAMLKAWHKRTDFTEFEVVSVEVKTFFNIKTSAGDIPFNYIWDRFDNLGNGVYRVVDYKTNRWGINPGDLIPKVQARAYGLAAQIQHPNAKRIWVQFDMLRHDGPVGVAFSRDDNIATWNFLKSSAERIIATPEGSAEERLNPACNFCVRKTSCETLLKNQMVGGVGRFASGAEAVDIRANLEFQKKAVTSALAELDTFILGQAKTEDVYGYESSDNELTIGVSSRRAVDSDRVSLVIGEQLFAKYGGKSITMANYDKLLKGDELTEDQKKELRGLQFKNQGEPRVSIKPKSLIDMDD